MNKIIDVTQGSKEWHEFRAKSFGASEAAAMLGISSYKTRSQLLKEKATGLAPEVDAATQARFDRGHEYEAVARPWAEEIIGEELYQVTLALGIDGITLSASMDGLTMMGDAGWEHKTMNAKLGESLASGEIPEEYHPQLEQQLLVSGAEKVLFMASKSHVATPDDEGKCTAYADIECDDGTSIRYAIYGLHAWYESNPDLRQRIIVGWKQFAADMAEYQHQEAEYIPAGKAPESLPALHIEVTGMVTASNLAEFKSHALAVIGGINKDLQTDEDFADAEKTVKWLVDVESRLDSAKEHALSQTASIDQLFKALDDIKENARRTRLDLDKLVKARKETRREEIRREGVEAYRQHIDGLNERLGRVKLPSIPADFGGVMKGKRTIASLKDAVNTELARVKIESSQLADDYTKNLHTIDTEGKGYEFLFSDIADLVTINPDHIAGVIQGRIAKHQAEEKRKEDEQRERIRREEEARAQREAEAKAEQERQKIRAEEQAKAKAEAEQSAPVVAQATDLHGSRGSVAYTADGQPAAAPAEKPRVRQQPAASRPTDQQIINTLAAAYRVDTATVVAWLKTMNLSAVAA